MVYSTTISAALSAAQSRFENSSPIKIVAPAKAEALQAELADIDRATIDRSDASLRSLFYVAISPRSERGLVSLKQVAISQSPKRAKPTAINPIHWLSLLNGRLGKPRSCHNAITEGPPLITSTVHGSSTRTGHRQRAGVICYAGSSIVADVRRRRSGRSGHHRLTLDRPPFTRRRCDLADFVCWPRQFSYSDGGLEHSARSSVVEACIAFTLYRAQCVLTTPASPLPICRLSISFWCRTATTIISMSVLCRG